MGYTKAPMQDTHNVIRIPTKGSPLVVSDDTVSMPTTLNFLDCFTRSEKQDALDPITRVHKRIGLTASTVTGTTNTSANIGAPFILNSDGINGWGTRSTDIIKFVGVGDTVGGMSVSVFQSAISNAYQAAGTIAVNSSNANIVALLTASQHLYTWTEAGGSFTDTDLSGTVKVNGTGNLVFLNGYLFAINYTNGGIYNSAAGGNLTTWNTTDYIVPEMYPDPVQWIDKHKNHLVAFSNTSIEFFYDAGIEVASPLARQESYAALIGLAWPTIGSVTHHPVARLDDDLYFIGVNSQNNKSLYRIRNFQVEELHNYWVNNLLNNSTYRRIQTMIISNDPMIVISTAEGNPDLVFNPKENNWWLLRTNATTSTPNTDFPDAKYRFSGGVYGYYATPVIYATQSTTNTTVYGYTPSTATSVTADVYTDVIDFGVNYYKHYARVDAIGDYGDNVLTLSYNGTPNFSQTYTACSPTRTPSNGYGYNASWYNLGAYRRMSMKLRMVGSDQAIHTGFDIEYNAGNA